MNNKLFLIILVTLFLFESSQAQQTLIDSLTQKLETLSEDDTLFVETSNRLSSLVYRANPFLAREYSERARLAAIELKDKKGEALAIRGIGTHFVARGHLDSAEVYFTESLEIFRELADERGIITMVAALGANYAMRDKYELATTYFLEALDFYLKEESFTGAGIMYNNIANIYLEQKIYEEAIKNYKESLAFHNKTTNRRNLAGPYGNIGKAFQEMGEIDSALIYLELGLENANEFNNLGSLSLIASSMGQIFIDRKEYETAIEYLKEAESVYNQLGNQRRLQEINYYFAEIYLNLNRLDVARSYAETIISVLASNDYGLIKLERDANGILAFIEAELGNFEEAYRFNSQYNTLKDSIIASENLETIASLQLEFESERQEQQINLLQAENEASQLKMVIVIGVSSFMIVVIVGWFWFRNKVKEEERKVRIQAIQQELDNYGVLIAEKDSFNRTLISKLKEIGADLKTTSSKKELTSVIDSLGQNINLNENDELLFQRIEQINAGFFLQLKNRYATLSKSEKRLASLVHMDLSNKQISNILHINPRSVNQAKYRLKKKLGLEPEQNLHEFLNTLEAA